MRKAIVMKKVSYRAKATEVDGLSERLMLLYQQTPDLHGDDVLQDVFTQMRQLSDTITIAIRRDKTKSLLEEIDAKRNNSLRNLSNLLLGYCSAPDKNIVESAEKVLEIFQKFGLKIIRENYDTKSSYIDSMLIKLNEDSCRDDINRLQFIRETIEQLRANEATFKEMAVQFDKDRAKDKSEKAAYVLGKELLDLINKNLLDYLKSMVTNNRANHIKFASEVEKLIERSNTQIALRIAQDEQAKAAKKETKE